MTDLGSFDGRDVRATSIAVRNAGDGLSDAMKVEPQLLHHGQEVTVAIRCVVDKVQFDPIKDSDDLIRKHVLKAGAATIIDSDVVDQAIKDIAERVSIAREQEQGVQRLNVAGGE